MRLLDCARSAMAFIVNPVMDNYHRSMQLSAESQRYLAGGVSSNFRLGEQPTTLFFEKAAGSRLTSVDGVSYIDYALGMGPVILGHSHPKVIRAVADSLADGQLYAGQHSAEIELAKLICEAVPCAERVRFNLSGSEAIQAALRLACAYTNRRKILKFEGHYHGWFDNIYASVRPTEFSESPQPESLGQDLRALDRMRIAPWNDLSAVEAALDHDTAAVIMEPVMCNTSCIYPQPGYLEGVRDLCSKNGTVLIFDEVITGFRLSLGGAQQLLGVTPDLAVFAKAFANGFPGSCIAGKAEIMELAANGAVMHGGTYNSNVVCTVAAIATVEELKTPDAYARLAILGETLIAGLRNGARLHQLPMLIQGSGAVFHTAFTNLAEIKNFRDHCQSNTALLNRFLAELLDEGVRITRRGTWFLSTAHSGDDIRQTIAAAERALSRIARA